MPHQKMRGECGFGKNPSRRIAPRSAAAAATPASAAFNSSSRSSGHSPMNLVVMWRLAGGLHWIARVRAQPLEQIFQIADHLRREVQSDEQSHDGFHCTVGPMRLGPILKRVFYDRPAVEVARDLLGKVLVHGPPPASSSRPRRTWAATTWRRIPRAVITDRTRVIFGPPGHAYVYFIYGMYECLNLVCEPEGSPGCVLIRALEPAGGIDLMQRRRPAARKPEDLASGPGKLTLAMGITRAQNGVDVTRGSLVVREPLCSPGRLRSPCRSESGSRKARTCRCASSCAGTGS